MPIITFLYFVFLQLQRTYPLAQLNLELGNTPSMLVVIFCSVLGNTLFSSSSCVGSEGPLESVRWPRRRSLPMAATAETRSPRFGGSTGDPGEYQAHGQKGGFKLIRRR